MEDLVRVIRCANCKHSLYITAGGYLWCRKSPMHTVDPNGYCDGGIQKEIQKEKEESDD